MKPVEPSAPENARFRRLNGRAAAPGEYVLYWMQQSARAEYNHALEYAAREANTRGLPLVVCFGLMDDYPEANARHYLFLLQGLRETAAAIQERGADFVLQHGAPPDVAVRFAQKAALVVCDRGYLRHQKAWRRQVATKAPCAVVEIESDVIVPVGAASPKAEFAARTLRPKLHRLLPAFLQPLRTVPLRTRTEPLPVDRWDPSEPEKLHARLKLDRTVEPVPQYFIGGTSEAKRRLRAFCQRRLGVYADRRNLPEDDAVSRMSAYLHFGQISPLWMVLEVQKHDERGAGAKAYVEELLVRRELAMNFTEYTENYDSYVCLPAWARQTLGQHAQDARPHRYTFAQLEQSKTHDPYWNAAMREMRLTGYLHNHLRMYWGKKLLEWGETPETAYRDALALNNKYFLCGRDAASFANIAWVFGLHDRPWGEREIYGKVRCMMASGLERKCDIREYVRQVAALPEARQ